MKNAQQTTSATPKDPWNLPIYVTNLLFQFVIPKFQETRSAAAFKEIDRKRPSLFPIIHLALLLPGQDIIKRRGQNIVIVTPGDCG